MTDIVKELREVADNADWNDDEADIIRSAADELERFRAERFQWETECDRHKLAMTIFRYFGFRKQDGTFSITGRPTTGDDSPDARRFPISETFSEFTVDSIIECALKIRMRGGTFQMFFGYKDWREIHEKLAAIEAAKKEAKP